MSENINNNDSPVVVETMASLTAEDEDCPSATSTAPDNSSESGDVKSTNNSDDVNVDEPAEDAMTRIRHVETSVMPTSGFHQGQRIGNSVVDDGCRGEGQGGDAVAVTTDDEQQDRPSWSSRAAEYATDDKKPKGETFGQQRTSFLSDRAAEFAIDNRETNKGKTVGQQSASVLLERAAEFAIDNVEDKTDLEGQVVNLNLEDGPTQPDPVAGPEPVAVPEPVPGAESMPGAHRRNSRLPPDFEADLEAPASTGVPRRSGDNLVEALPVEEDPNAPDLMEANLVNQEDLVKQADKARNKRRKMFGCAFVALAVMIALKWSLFFGLAGRNDEESSGDDDMASNNNDTSTHTASSTKPLPAMENLELLYDGLPEKSKERLYNMESAQFKAWDWLLNHPNLTSLEEWRKRQIFAMTTFFYSFEGPSWPEEIRSRWLNTSTSECSWVSTDAEVGFWTQVAAENFGPGVYGYQDFQPCNEDGELQTIGLSQLFLPANVTPSIPPEMEMLTSMRILMIFFSQFSAKFSDLLPPEVARLPNISAIQFQTNGMSGTIPKDIQLMTGLRHFLIGGNKLSDTFPTEIGKLTSLEYFIMNGMEDVGGMVPTELGLLTGLEELCLTSNALIGSIPSELGLLTNVKKLWLGNLPEEGGTRTNDFVGSIPRELLELSDIQELVLPYLPNLSGSLPTEMMPNVTILRIEGSPHLSATIPEEICFLQEEPPPSAFLPGNALDFDCSDLLCGCNCECVGGNANETNPDW